jgi:hypothetical protein
VRVGSPPHSSVNYASTGRSLQGGSSKSGERFTDVPTGSTFVGCSGNGDPDGLPGGANTVRVRRTKSWGPVWALAFSLALVACGGQKTAPPPGPGTSQGVPPDLRGVRVLVLPVQQVVGVAGDIDAELAFGLSARASDVSWILPAEIERMLERSPSIDARARGLPVGKFLAAEVRRVGDPLFGQLRRMSALVDAEAILIPVRAVWAAEPGAQPTVQLAVALLEPRTGRVRWFGIVAGEAFPAGDLRGLTSAVDVLARTLLWYEGG